MSSQHVALGALFLGLAGSATRTGYSGPGIVAGPKAGVVVLHSPAASPAPSKQFGESLVACVAGAITVERPELRVVAVDDFAGAVFPGTEPADIPVSQQSLAPLVDDPEFLTRAAATGVRYLITVEGQTRQSRAEGRAMAGAGPGGAAILGFWIWERESTAGATVYDFEAHETVGLVDVQVSGRPWFAVLGIFPLSVPSFTEGWACQKLGTSLAKFLRGRVVAS